MIKQAVAIRLSKNESKRCIEHYHLTPTMLMANWLKLQGLLFFGWLETIGPSLTRGSG
jgi:hypothetical protein